MATTSVLAVENRVAVAKLTGELHLYGQSGPVLDRVLGEQPGMIGGAASDDEDLVDLAQLLIGQSLLVEHDAVVDEMAQQGVGDGGGLLGDLLEHEVLVATLFGGRHVPVDMELPGIRRVVRAVEIGDPVTVGGDHHSLVLTQFDRVAGVFDERSHIGPDEHLAVTDPEYQRGGTSRGDDGARVVGVGEDEREVALQARQNCHHGGDEVTCGGSVVVLPRHQMHGHLGVGVAGELHARGFQFGAHRRVVLDDPVVDDRDLSRSVEMRVGVAVGRPTVGRPARVAEAGAARQGRGVGFGQSGLQIGQPSCPATNGQPAISIEQSDARRVVSAVLHPAQRVDNDVAGRTLPDVADDSTHSHPG